MKRRNVFKLLGALLISPAILIPNDKIKTKIRTLKCKWTMENPSELTQHYGMNNEEEIINLMAEQIRKKIDQEIKIRNKN